jgi:hypothetical protein
VPLHPLESRKKRLENALTAGALFVVLFGVMFFMSYDGEGWPLAKILGGFAPILVTIPGLIVAGYVYVRGAERP